jgi:X-Pro dipeptidyl-peptidase
LALITPTALQAGVVGNQFLRDNLTVRPDMVVDGITQPIFSPIDDVNFITEEVWVESPTDTDRDGKRDLLCLQIKRPTITSEDLAFKVPVIAELSPYNAGTFDSRATPYLVDVDQDYPGEDNESTLDMTYDDIKFNGHTYQDIVNANFAPIWLPAQRSNRGESRDGTPYTWDITYWYRYFLMRGYAVVRFHIFGSRAEGVLLAGGYEETIGAAALVDWLNGRVKAYTNPTDNIEVKAYWTTGEVAMTGVSYNGALPTAAAVTGVEGLKTIIPIAPVTSWYEYYRANGLNYAPEGCQGEDCQNLIPSCWARGYGSDSPVAPTNQVWRAYDTIQWEVTAGTDRKSGDYNSFWDDRNMLQYAENIKCSVLMMHGLNDLNVKLKHTALLYEACKKYGVPHKVIFHQGPHESVWNHYGLDFIPNMQKWMDYHLYGIDNGIMDSMPNVVIQNNNTLEWETFEDWPMGQYKKLFFNGAKSGIEGIGSLSINKPGSSEEITFVDSQILALARPKDTYPNDFLGRQMDSAQYTRWRDHIVGGSSETFDPDGTANKDRLLYVTDIIENTRIDGTAKVTAKVAASKNVGAISAMLVDYGEDYYVTTSTANSGYTVDFGGAIGAQDLVSYTKSPTSAQYRIISRGSVDVQNPNESGDIWSDAADTNFVPAFLYQTASIQPGEFYSYTWELAVTDYEIKEGHRLGLILYGSDPEFTNRPYNPTTFTVEIGPDSYLSLPIAGYLKDDELDPSTWTKELTNEAAGTYLLRIPLGLTSAETAQVTGIDVSTVNAAISGKEAVFENGQAYLLITLSADVPDTALITGIDFNVGGIHYTYSFSVPLSAIRDETPTSPSGGCNSGLGALALWAALPFIVRKKRGCM